MTEPYAKIIADSVSAAGHRLTTMEVQIHRFVLAEMNTHRVFSRNSASSRAIPLARQMQRVRDGIATPVAWASEQRGMQGGDEVADVGSAEVAWKVARNDALKHAEELAAINVHKSIVNRLLEPFMWHTVVVTSTAWENFFRQRCSPLAQPEIRVAAECMREVYEKSIPEQLPIGAWHLPYIDDETRAFFDDDRAILKETPWVVLREVSAARCARVSYLTQDGKRDPHEDLKLYERLTSADPMHASPLEHVATPWHENVQQLTFGQDEDGIHIYGPLDPEGAYSKVLNLPRVGNLLGWRQLRLEVELQKGWQSFS